MSFCLELMMWLEHTTCWLRISCSTDWATLAYGILWSQRPQCIDDSTIFRFRQYDLWIPLRISFSRLSIQSQRILLFVLCRISCRIRQSILTRTGGFRLNHPVYFFFRHRSPLFFFPKFRHFFSVFSHLLVFSSEFYIYITILIILIYGELFTFSTWFSTFYFPI